MAERQEALRPLLVSPYGTIGGAQLVLLRIIDEMEYAFEPLGLVMGEGPLADMLRARGVPTDVVYLPGKWAVRRFGRAARETAQTMRPHDVSLVHANGIKAAVFGIPLARQLKVPLIWMKHDHVLDGVPSHLLARRCDGVICVSDAMRSSFPPTLRERISVVYPGVNPPEAIEPIGEERLIVAVGRLDPAKGFDNLLRAAAELRRRGIDASIVVAGPVDRVHPEHADELRSLVRELGLTAEASVGWVDDLAPLYTRARVVALASKPRRGGRPGEGAPIVLLEGMAHGRPVVAPDEAGISEIVGDAGTLVQEELGVAALVAALEPYLRDADLAAQVGRRGAARVQERFTLSRTVEALHAAYRCVL